MVFVYSVVKSLQVEKKGTGIAGAKSGGIRFRLWW